MNKAVLQCDRTEIGDETYTPFYAVAPILKYIPKDKIIWCPFDEEWSAYYQMFKEQGYEVVRGSIAEDNDFFAYEPDRWDVIVSNPPFSKKDQVLERLYSFNKPFAVLLPLTTLQGQKRFEYLRRGIQILAFDKRICYYRNGNFTECASSCSFASVYFCRDILPEKLILEELVKYERTLRVSRKSGLADGRNKEGV